MFFGGNLERALIHFFFTAAHFHFTLVDASISHFVTATTKFSCCSPNKKNVSSVFLLIELPWAAVNFLFFSVFLLLSIPNL